jgi:hypothetical protein
MNKGLVITFLGIALVSFTLGTMSTVNAEEGGTGKKQMAEINQKLDLILKNQTELKKAITYIKHQL